MGANANPITDSQRLLVVSLRQAGHNFRYIASEARLARNSVMKICKEEGVAKPEEQTKEAENAKKRELQSSGNQAAPTPLGSPQDTVLAHALRTNMQERLADKTHKFVDTLTDERIDEVSIPQAVNCISKLIDASTKLERAQQDRDVTDSLTALLVHGAKRQEELRIPFPKITTVPCDQVPEHET